MVSSIYIHAYEVFDVNSTNLLRLNNRILVVKLFYTGRDEKSINSVSTKFFQRYHANRLYDHPISLSSFPVRQCC